MNKNLNSQIDFYSHAREGRDFSMPLFVRPIRISTHTPARGVTGSDRKGIWICHNFYSHAREGRDDVDDLSSTLFIISTHTPARDVTDMWERIRAGR